MMQYDDYEYDDSEQDSTPSRSQKKREMTALQKAAEKIVKLGPELIKKSGLPEKFVDAVLETQKIKKHEARRRQIQYLGKLMREIDSEPILRFIENVELGNKDDAKKFQQLEKWRDALVAGEFELINELAEKFPSIDRQRILQLARNAGKEIAAGKPPKSSRALFKALRELEETNA
jgi:ribosome-associated protein